LAKLNQEELTKFCAKQFDTQFRVLRLWQALGDNFYPERADFLRVNEIGDEYIDGLVDSYPILARRDLGDSFAAMLRDGKWFDMGTADDEIELSHDAKIWLESASKLLLKMMNDRSSGFAVATKAGDHDFATFGQCVISVNLNKKNTGLLYQCWHLRDCTWWNDESGQVAGVCRKWSPTQRDLVNQFGDEVHAKVKKGVAKKPFDEVECRHIVMPSDMYGDPKFEQFKYVSVFMDIKNKKIMEEVGINHKYYVIPRFHPISDQPFAISPATIAALPNARVLQAMMFTLLEAGERHTRPPLLAAEGRIRGDVDLTGDGITYVDIEEGEKLSEAFRPLYNDKSGFNIGENMRGGIVDVISECFYKNRLVMPDMGNWTATATREYMKQYRRQNLPLFSPLESEYNGQICEISFELALQAGFLGSKFDIPDDLKNAFVEFKFRSPLSKADEELKTTQYQLVTELLNLGLPFDESLGDNLDFDTMLRDAMDGIDAPEKWKNSTEEVMQVRNYQALQEAAQAQITTGEEVVG